MNPLTNVKNITKLNEIELASGLIHKKSWHDMYKESAWIFIGGLPYGLTEGDVLAVFSQYGEIVNLNLVRDKKTGKSKGFCFLCYANQKSTVLAVDNLNGIKLCSRTIRVDHVANYKPPKEDDRDDEITKMLKSEGCAPKPLDTNENSETPNDRTKKKKSKKEKKEKKKKKRKHSSDERDAGNEISGKIEIKKEKEDSGYDKYDISLNKTEDKEKQKYEKRNYEQSHVESSHSHEKFTSKSDQLYDSCSKRNSAQYNDRYLNRHRAKDRSESEYHHKEVHKESDREHASVLRNVRRERSSSSSVDSSRNHTQSAYCKPQRTQSKSKHSDRKRKLRESKQNSSSSSDEDSSSQSSSQNEKHKPNRENSKRERYKRYDEKKSFHVDRRDKHDSRSESSDYKSHRIGHYGKTERDFNYRSKNKYGSDDTDDNNHKDSYHRSKHDRK